MDYPQYDPRIADKPLADDELEALDALLQSSPSEAAMNIEALDGYLTALLVGPPGLAALRTADWLPAAWGGDGPEGAPFASNRQRKRATVLVLRHLHAIACQLQRACESPSEWQPVFSVAETAEGDVADAEDWCIGFLQAVDLAPDEWAALFDDQAWRDVLAPIVELGGENAAPPGEPAARDALSRRVMDAISRLHRQRHPTTP